MTDRTYQCNMRYVLQADRLTDNWYVTAADVAALTQVSPKPKPIITAHLTPANCCLNINRAFNQCHGSTHHTKACVQGEAAALNVPVRFLQQLRRLLPPSQAVKADDTSTEEDARPDTDMDSVGILEVSSEAEEESYLGASELQTALMAAPQMVAATSGTLCCQ